MQSATITTGNENLWTRLQQLNKDALDEAKKSPCVRRKYGAVIGYETYTIAGHNRRVSRCCDGDICVRDLFKAQHGHNTDLGAEVHAEQDLIANNTVYPIEVGQFLIAGYNRDGNKLYGLDNWPCYVCARIIKSTNKILSVWVPESDGTYSNYPIDEILETYNNEILGSVGDF